MDPRRGGFLYGVSDLPALLAPHGLPKPQGSCTDVPNDGTLVRSRRDMRPEIPGEPRDRAQPLPDKGARLGSDTNAETGNIARNSGVSSLSEDRRIGRYRRMVDRAVKRNPVYRQRSQRTRLDRNEPIVGPGGGAGEVRRRREEPDCT